MPGAVKGVQGWRARRVAGAIDLSVVGVLASLAEPLAHAGVSLFAVSTFDTDYLLVREYDLDRAIEALRGDGHSIHPDEADRTGSVASSTTVNSWDSRLCLHRSGGGCRANARTFQTLARKGVAIRCTPAN